MKLNTTELIRAYMNMGLTAAQAAQQAQSTQKQHVPSCAGCAAIFYTGIGYPNDSHSCGQVTGKVIITYA